MATKISVRYGNTIMEEGDGFETGKTKQNLIFYGIKRLFHLGNYNEQLRVIDFPVYVSGQNDTNLTPLVPVN
jgi:hypothetical protein